MILRTIIIDESKCDGCGLCVNACHEGALALVDGKAKLVREDMCDGMGDCLPACPRDAISFAEKDSGTIPMRPMGGPNLMAMPGVQWPIQIGLVSPVAGFFKGRLVIGADCTAFTADDYKKRFIHGDALIIGCPKLDERSRFDKIADIIRENDITSVDVIRMEVPCCGALVRIVQAAIEASGKDISMNEIVIRRDGSVLRYHHRELIDAPGYPAAQSAGYHHVVHGTFGCADIGLDPEAGHPLRIGVTELHACPLVGDAPVHVEDQSIAGIEKTQILGEYHQ